MLLLQLDFSFKASADSVQKLIKSTDEVDKEIDFSIHLFEKEIYFGVTSFSDSLKDFSKDTNDTSIEIKNLKYSNGLTSPIARITSIRSHHEYMNRRLAVRIAKEGKHKLDSDYIYVVFPKSAKGFGGGLDAISKDFTFTDSKYTYQSNGITGIIIGLTHWALVQSNCWAENLT